MDPSIIYGLDIALVLLIVYVVAPNVFEYFSLFLAGLPTWVALRIRGTKLKVQLWIDRQSFRPGVLGRLLTEIQLYRIRQNPAYRDLFEQVKSQSLQEGDD